MIKKLLLSIAILCWGFGIHAQNIPSNSGNPINVSNSTNSVTGLCFSAEAVGYRNADGVFYYNYSRTYRVSYSTNAIIQMTGKYLLWIEPDNNGVVSLYQHDGTTTRKLSTSAVNNEEVKISPGYFLWTGRVGAADQVFRYNRTTGAVTQVTNETGRCSNLIITDPQPATFSFVYTIPNTLKSGYFNLIASTLTTPRRIVYDEYSGYGIAAGGYVFFSKYVTPGYQVFKCNVNATGATQITFNSGSTYMHSTGTDKKVAYYYYDNSASYTDVYDVESARVVFSKQTSSTINEFLIGKDKYFWTQYDGHDYEIISSDGTTESQITDNVSDDYALFITSSGDLIWKNYLLGKFRFMYYNSTSGAITQIDLENGPDFFLVEGGTILAQQSRNSIYQGFLYTFSSYKLSSIDLRCDETSKNGTAVFSIEKPLNPGVLGLDFKVIFDPAAVSVGSVDVLNPTDALGNTAAVAYTVSGNTINISYYLRSVPGGASIITTGPVIGINLVRNSATTYTSNYSLLKVSEVEEGYAIGSVQAAAPITASYNISPETHVGLLLYGANPAKPMAHYATNPAAVFQADYACVRQPLTPTVVNPTSTGIFRIKQNTINSQLQFVKELPGSYNVSCSSSNIMTFMNGSDWALAADISRGNTAAITSPLQYVAADVNMDGKVNAADASLISSRSVLRICEYPQKWNYVLENGIPVPGPNYKPSKDFVFVHESTFTATASRNAVPPVSDCLPMPAVQACPASDALATKYAGILLGDVNLSYSPSTALSRIGAVNEVEFSALQNPLLVSVSGIAADRLKALDFKLVLPEGVSVEDVVAADPAVNLNWHTIDSLLMVTSFVDGDSANLEELFRLKLKDGLLNNLQSGDFYINGEPAGFQNRIVNGTTDESAGRARLSPNPTAGTFVLEFREAKLRSVTVSDLEGKIIRREKAESISAIVDINDAPAGVYFVKVESTDSTEVYKVVKQ